MSPSDGEHGDDVDAAAHGYDRVLRAVGQRDGALFDVCLLGVGEEGHIASIFPGSPAVDESSVRAVAVRGCPKPPPTRISLTLACIQDSHEVWLMTTGITKAAAVSAALSGSSPADLPAAGAVGIGATIWFLDRDAGSEYLSSQ
jgi:6-phosphogluconolactonase